MDLRKLRHATVLATEASFSRAAEKLNLSQSALSKSISFLEQELGITLFERNSGGVAITAIGKEFINGANRLLHQARSLSYDTALLRDGYTGNVSFGMGSFPAAAYQQSVLTELLRDHPGLCVRVDVSTPEHLLEHLASEQIEFFIGDSRGIELGQQFVVDPLVHLRTAFFVRSGHPLLSADTTRAKDLHLYPIVGAPIVEEKLNSTDTWLGMRPIKGFHLQVASENILTLKALTITTDAILISPYSVVATECEIGALIELQLPRRLERSYINVDLVRLANRKQSAAAKVVIEVVRRIAKELRQLIPRPNSSDR